MALTRRAETRILTAPLVLFLLAMLGFPTLVNLVYSVSDVSFETLRAPRPEGLANYAAVLGDGAFWGSLGFSLRFGALTAAIEVALGLFLAVFLAPILRPRPWLLAVLTLPMMVAPAMMGLMYRLLLHEFVGPVPHYLFAWFGGSPAFLSPAWVFWTVATVEVLQWTPFALLLFHLAYGAIPEDLREAARMDGASEFRVYRHIVFPHLSPITLSALIILGHISIKVFDLIVAVAGKQLLTEVPAVYMWVLIFDARDYAKGAAIATLLLVGISVLIIPYLWYVVRSERRA